MEQKKSYSSGQYDRNYATKVTIILGFLMLLTGYIEAMLTPSLLSIAKDFKVTFSQVALVLSLYVVGGVALTPVFGKLGDIYGKKKMLSFVLVIYLIAAVSTSISATYEVLLLSRTIQGIGLAIFPLGSALAREEFPREIIPKVEAIFGSLFGASFAIGLPIGSYVSNSLGWRYTYYTALPLLIVATIFAILTIKESRYTRPNVTVDYAGAILLAAVLSIFVLFVSEGSSWGWPSSDSIMKLFSGSMSSSELTSLLIIFDLFLLFSLVLQERRELKNQKEPIFSFKLLTNRNVILAYVAGLIAQFALFLATITLTYRLEYPMPAGFGENIFVAGITVTPFAIGAILGGILASTLINKTGAKPMTIAGTIVAASGFLLEATIPGYTLLWIYSIICGVGVVMILGTLSNFVIFSVNPREIGMATGMQSTFYNVGSSIGSPVAAAILTTFTVTYVEGAFSLRLASHPAFSYVFVFAAIALLVTGMLALLTNEVLTKKRQEGVKSEY
jgi:MFS family permease